MFRLVLCKLEFEANLDLFFMFTVSNVSLPRRASKQKVTVVVKAPDSVSAIR